MSMAWGNPFAGRGWRVRVTLALVAGFVLSAVGWAIAAGVPLSIASVSPANGAVVTNARPTITVVVQDGVAPYTGEIIVDGVSQALTPDGSGTFFSFTPSANLSDGIHTVTFNASDSDTTPGTASRTWSFDVEVTPVISAGYPGPGAIVSRGWSGWIYARVVDNSAPVSTNITVDGTPLSSQYATAYDAASSSYNVQGIAYSLADGLHTMQCTVVDEGGHEVTYSWSFVAGGNLTMTETGIADGQGVATNVLEWHFLVKSEYTTPDFYVTIDGSAANYSYTETYSNANHDMDLEIVPSAGLSDGPHTVRVSATASPGLTLDRTYNVSLRIPPTVTHL